MFLEILIVVLLTVLNGVLAMSELAVVSARPARLKVMADHGNRGARLAMQLAEDPGRFLSTVQIGITLVGVLSGAFSGATLGSRFSSWLLSHGLSKAMSDAVGVGLVVVAITYLSLIIGELVPKQLALKDPESIASKAAPSMVVLSKLAAPLVWLLDTSGQLILKLLGRSGKSDGTITDEEIRTVLAEAHSAGVIESEEQAMISGVMRLADRTAKALMTPRREVEVIDIENSFEEIRAQIQQSHRSRLPVRKGSSDEVLGVLFVKDFFEAAASGKEVDILALAREVQVVSDLANASTVIEVIRKTPTHMVVVYDEYGHFEGIVTSGDILEAIVGVLQEEETEEPAIFKREDGSYLVSGWMPIDEFAAFMDFTLEDDIEYQTVAGLVLEELKHLPNVGESFIKHGWRFEVADMDGRRIDKLLITPQIRTSGATASVADND